MLINIKEMEKQGFIVDVALKHGTIAIHPINPLNLDFDVIRQSLLDQDIHPRDIDDSIEDMVSCIHSAEIVRAIKATS